MAHLETQLRVELHIGGDARVAVEAHVAAAIVSPVRVTRDSFAQLCDARAQDFQGEGHASARV